MGWLACGTRIFALLAVAATLAACKRPNPAFRESQSSGGETQGETGAPFCACEERLPCDDANATDPWEALGVGCERVMPTDPRLEGATGALKILSGVGTSGAYDPTQGQRILAMGTGLIDTLLDPSVDCVSVSANFGEEFAPGLMLPPPIIPEDVPGSCLDDPALIGVGDCSNTIEAQFFSNAFDYAETRFTLEVPEGADGLALDFAFFTSEYPNFIGSNFNDMFLVWLESEAWTGNIALDSMGHAVAVDVVHLEYKDDDLNLPQLADTCMKGHGATKWLTASGPVREGEAVTVVAAIFDGGDALLDAFALVDGFRWQCGACP